MPDTENASRSPGAIQKRFAYLAVPAIVALTFLISYLAYREYNQQFANILSSRAGAVRERQIELEGLAAVKRSEVRLLASTLASDLEMNPAARQRALSPVSTSNAEVMWRDERPDISRMQPAGLIVGSPNAVASAGNAEVAAIQRLFPVQAAAHEASARLGWTYYASAKKDLFAIYPWTAPEALLGNVASEQSVAFANLFQTDAFSNFENAPGVLREPFWTPIHLDFLQDSRVITVCMLVETNGVRYGLFAAQIPVRTIANILLKFDTPETALSLIDERGEILATSSLSLSTERFAVTLNEIARTRQSGFEGVVNGQNFAVSNISGAPWRLIVTTPESVIVSSALAATWPYGLALMSIFLTFASLVLLLQHQIIRPVSKLVNFIAADSRGIAVPAPRLPHAWHVLAERVFAAARNREAHLHQLRAMIDGIPLRAVYVDHDYIYRDANKEFLEFVGLKLEELVGKTVGEVLGRGVQEEYIRRAPSIFNGEVSRFEGWIEYQGRDNRYLQVSILPFKALDEDKPGFLTFTRDLTELKAAEVSSARNMAAFTASDAMHRSVVLSSLDGIVVMDEAGIAIEFNPAAQTMFGYSETEAAGRPVSELIVPPSSRVAHARGLERYLGGGGGKLIGHRIEIEGMRKDGSLIPVELTITEVGIGDRRIFISHIRDLTEQRAKKRELDEQREKLHHAEKMTAMGSLLAGVAHELNNPLAIVVAQSTLLEEYADTAAIKKRAERIHAAAERCGRIVKTFLAMARQQAPTRENVDISKVVEFALTVMAYSLQSTGIVVETRLADEALLVEADSDQLSQVFSNLLINAQQAMAAQEAARKLLIETGRSASGNVFVRIADNGPGVAPEVRERIFDAFFTTKPVGVGTGIGLSVCRNIVQAHGGSLILEESGKSGASFLIQLPAASAAASIAVVTSDNVSLKGYSILVVDDEPDVGGTLAEILESMGARAEFANSRAKAIELIETQRFDLVMTDLRMPDGGGTALHKDLAGRKHPLAERMIFVTGDTVAGPTFISTASGQVGAPILEKPYSRKEVFLSIKALMRDADRPPARTSS